MGSTARMRAVGIVLVLLAATAASGQKSAVVPDDCLDEPFVEGGEKGALALTCHLSAINSAAEKTNFGVVPADHTLALTVKCKHAGIGSSLEPSGFASLSRLRKLALVDCEITNLTESAFHGLNRLRSLRVDTGGRMPLKVNAHSPSSLE